METNINEINSKDSGVWKIEKKRAAFKLYLFIYLIANIFLWAIWYISIPHNMNVAKTGSFPWALWPTLFWGIGVLYSYFELHKLKNHLAKTAYQKF